MAGRMRTMFDPVRGKTVPVFLYYSIPSVLSMMAISCAVIVDGMFLGRTGGAHALAAVNLTLPVHALLIGIALMLSVGGAARCGRALGRKENGAANRIFSQTLTVVILVGFAATALSFVATDTLVRILGARGAVYGQTREYLRVALLFFACPMGIIGLSCFLRTDGRPLFAACVMVAGSGLNVFLDWLFIVEWNMGLTGAALGTGLSELATVLILALPFIMKKTRLRFAGGLSDLTGTFRSAVNGFSEFSNEISGGLLTLVFNWVLMDRMGEAGVAAFSVINYMILCGIIINCGISDAIQPVVSLNYGAKKPGRISGILGISTASVFGIGSVVSLCLLLFPETLTGLFIEAADPETEALALRFAAFIWPVFLLNGINIVATSYLTAMNQALGSTAVSLSRTLFLPVILLLILPMVLGHDGIMAALPLAELLTLILAICLIRKNSPSKLIALRYP